MIHNSQAVTNADTKIDTLIKLKHRQTFIRISDDVTLTMGEGVLFQHVNPKGWMWEGTGDRSFSAFIAFNATFPRAPYVSVALNGVDASHAQNLRLKLEVSKTTESGFVVTAKT